MRGGGAASSSWEWNSQTRCKHLEQDPRVKLPVAEWFNLLQFIARCILGPLYITFLRGFFTLGPAKLAAQTSKAGVRFSHQSTRKRGNCYRYRCLIAAAVLLHRGGAIPQYRYGVGRSAKPAAP